MSGLRRMGSLGRTPSAPAAPAKPPVVNEAMGRPAIPARPTLFPQGPELLGLGRRRGQGTGGPGLKPVGFPGTQPEWVWYFGSSRVEDDPKDPRVGPYTGGREGLWAFQVPDDPEQPRAAGASISDFLYVTPTGAVVVRIEGFYWHTAADAAQQARDFYLGLHAGNEGTRVESVEDGEFMYDASGSAACRLLADILAGRSRIGAIGGGTAAPPRYAPELQAGAV